MANLVRILELRGDSYLTWAKSKDVELHRAASEAGRLRSPKHRPQTFEMSEHAQIEAANFQLLQQLVKVTARDKKYRPKSWPTPETAAEIIKREDADKGYDDLMSEIVFVSQDEFDAHIAEHRSKQQIVRHEPER